MKHVVRCLTLLIFGLALFCCSPRLMHGGNSAQPSQHVNSAQSVQGRRLTPDASFADLIASMPDLDGHRRKIKGCLLSQRSDGFVVQAQVVSTIGVIPSPPADLDRYLQRTPRVRVLSPQGYLGPAAKVAFAAITSSELPAAYATALILTDQGLYVRSADFEPDPNSPLTAINDVDLELALSGVNYSPTFYVSAEATVPVSRLYRILSVLGNYGPVVLAIPFRPPPEPAPVLDGACSALPAGTAPEFTVAMKNRGILIEDAFYECVRKVRAEHLDGRVLLAVALREDGSIRGSCIRDDQTKSEYLTACVRSVMAPEPVAEPDVARTRTLLLPLIMSKPRYSRRAYGAPVCR